MVSLDDQEEDYSENCCNDIDVRVEFVYLGIEQLGAEAPRVLSHPEHIGWDRVVLNVHVVQLKGHG